MPCEHQSLFCRRRMASDLLPSIVALLQEIERLAEELGLRRGPDQPGCIRTHLGDSVRQAHSALSWHWPVVFPESQLALLRGTCGEGTLAG